MSFIVVRVDGQFAHVFALPLTSVIRILDPFQQIR